MIGLEFLRHRNRFLARVRRRYFSAEPSYSLKYVCVRRLHTFLSLYFTVKSSIHVTSRVFAPPKHSEAEHSDGKGKNIPQTD